MSTFDEGPSRFELARERTMDICFEHGVTAGLGQNDEGDYTAWVADQRTTGLDPLDTLEAALARHLEARRVLVARVAEIDGLGEPDAALSASRPAPRGPLKRLLGFLGVGLLGVGSGAPATPTPPPTPTAVSVPLTAAAGTPCAPDWTAILVTLGAIVVIGLLCWFGMISGERANGRGWESSREWQFKARCLEEEVARLKAEPSNRLVELELDNNRLREEVALLSNLARPEALRPERRA